MEIVEKQIRRNNIVIQGIEDGGNDNVKDKVKELFTRIGADVKIEKDITEIIRLGPYNPAKKRAVLVKLNGWEQKMKIYNQTKKLKGSNIWINDEFSRKVIQDRKELIPRLKEARDKGHSASLRYNKLIIDGVSYGIEDMSRIEPEIQESKKRATSEWSPQNDNQRKKKTMKMERKN